MTTKANAAAVFEKQLIKIHEEYKLTGDLPKWQRARDRAIKSYRTAVKDY